MEKHDKDYKDDDGGCRMLQRHLVKALKAASISSEISDHPYKRPEERPKSKTKIPRPPNAWIIYRSEGIEEMKNAAVTDMSKLNQTELSKMIGIKWRNESIQVKHIYQEKANEASRVHMLKYPQYKFRPNRKHDRIAKIGTRTVRNVSHHRKSQVTKTAQKTRKNHKTLKTKTPLKQVGSSDGDGDDDDDYDYKCSQRAERQLRRNVKVRGERHKRYKQEEEDRNVNIMSEYQHLKVSSDRDIRPESPPLSLPDPIFTLPVEVENDMTNISTTLIHDSNLSIYDSNALINQDDNRLSFDDFAYNPEVMFAPETADNLANEWASNAYGLGTDVGVDNVIGIDNYHYINDIFGNIPTAIDITPPLPSPPSAFKYMNDMMDISTMDLGTIHQDDRVGISSSCSSSSTVSTTSTTHSLDSYDNSLPDFLNIDITEGLNDTHIGERARSLIADYYLYEEREDQQQQLQFQQEHHDIPTQQDIFKTFQRQLAETRTRVSQDMT